MKLSITTSLLLALPIQFASAAMSDIKNYRTSRCASYDGRLCEQCAGDCDVDSDCKNDLVCYQYSGKVSSGRSSESNIPSCYEAAGGWRIMEDWDYCVDPITAKQLMSAPWAQTNVQLRDYGASPMWVTGNGKGAKASYGLKLGNCAGDCDYDSDCGSGMKCHQRSTSKSVPGCSGTPVDDHDYCIYPGGKFPTPRPTKRPTRSPTRNPTRYPTGSPTRHPTVHPTRYPTTSPTRAPTRFPTPPTVSPTKYPTTTNRPTTHPTKRPTAHPTKRPTAHPTAEPTAEPTGNLVKSCLTEISCPVGKRNNRKTCPSGGCTQQYCCDRGFGTNPPRPPTVPPQTTRHPTNEPTAKPTATTNKNCKTHYQCPPYMRNTGLPCPNGGCTQDLCCGRGFGTNPPKPPTFPPQTTRHPTNEPTATPTIGKIKYCKTDYQCPPYMRNTLAVCPKRGCTQDVCCQHMAGINPPKPPTFPPQTKRCDPDYCEDWGCEAWCKCFKAHPYLQDYFDGPNPTPEEEAARERCPSDNDECDCDGY